MAEGGHDPNKPEPRKMAEGGYDPNKPDPMEPEWFEPRAFCEGVLYFSFRMMDVAEQLGELRLGEGAERRLKSAVHIVGRAVYSMQLLMRQRLMPLFVRIFNKAYGSSRDEYIPRDILHLLSQEYVSGDTVKYTLSAFAVVAELIIFMNFVEFPLPVYYYHVPCQKVYLAVKDKVQLFGGWDAFVDRVERTYVKSGMFSTAYIAYEDNVPIPHAESCYENLQYYKPKETLVNPIDPDLRTRHFVIRLINELYSCDNVSKGRVASKVPEREAPTLIVPDDSGDEEDFEDVEIELGEGVDLTEPNVSDDEEIES